MASAEQLALVAKSQQAISAVLTQGLGQSLGQSLGQGLPPFAVKTTQTPTDINDGASSDCSYDTTTSTSTSKCSKQTKSRFTEMAKCMLEILDDLQVNKMQPQDNAVPMATGSSSSPTSSSSTNSNDHLVTITKNNSIDSTSSSNEDVDAASVQSDELTLTNESHINAILDKHLRKRTKAKYEPTSTSDTSYASTLPEFHIYEEVLYEAMENADRATTNLGRTTSNATPPLPDKTTELPPSNFTRNCVGRRSANFLNNNNYNRNVDEKMPSSHGQWPSQRPKQRSNIYSLFTDPERRRNISKSLEREYITRAIAHDKPDLDASKDAADIRSSLVIDTTEYGFKASI